MEYVARLLSQFYVFGWAGALIVTVAAACAGLDAAATSDLTPTCRCPME